MQSLLFSQYDDSIVTLNDRHVDKINEKKTSLITKSLEHQRKKRRYFG